MKAFLRRLLKSVAYLAAALVILLAVAVGLFRLMLPRLPAYQEEIKAWANSAIGLQVEFTGMDARWRLSGPELSFYNASLAVPDMENGVFSAEEVSVGVGLMRLLLDRTLVVDRLGIRDAELVVRRDDDGGWRLQGVRAAELRRRFALPAERRDITVVAEDLTLDYQPADGTAPLAFAVDALQLSRRGPRIDAEAVVGLPDTLGNRVLLTAGQRPGRNPEASTFQLTVEGRGLKLAGLSALQPAALPQIAAGRADVNLAFDWRDDRVTNATADVDIDGLATADTPGAFGLAGRFEFEHGADGWLVAAEDLRLDTAAGTWPSADLQVEASTAPDRTLRTLTASASYLKLADLAYLVPWMPDAWRAEARRFAPSGIVRDLALSLGKLQDEVPRYDIAMRLEDAGMLAGDRWPGVTGFSGSLRANQSGGRVQIDAADMELDLSQWLADPVDLTRAEGTVIWRRNRNGIIVLSDSVTLDSSELSSRSSLQVSLPADGGSPVVDFDSRWSISDISAARKYLPVNLIKPSLYRWLNSALVAGRATQGTTRFSGPLDQFPFDNDEGVFRIEASLEDATLRYSELWPDVENMDLELVVDRTRLYSDTNTAVSGGNSVVNAKIEIADLREPVLTIDAFASGTMQSIRQFARNSPIADVFGGRLDNVSVAGDASFNLDLRYPIANRDDYAFTTRIRASNASLRVAGLTPAVTELNGIVSVSRRDIATESLFGRFLGEPVTIDLRPAGEAEPSYSVIARVQGTATSAGIAAGFTVPAEHVLNGTAPYLATLRFPRAGSADPQPMQVDVETDMQGLAVSLPEPVGKEAAAARPLSLTIEFPREAAIDVQGRFGDTLRWSLAFLHGDAGWDFDRGVLAAGGADPGSAGTRGLHITGQTPVFRLSEWLALASDAESGGPRLADRIRSIDLTVQNLFVLGQHFSEHRVVVDRSASDWLVQVAGGQARGSVTIPYDFHGGRPLILDMQRLVLPGSDDDAPQTAITTDPRTVPPVSIRAAEFALGERQLGKVEAIFERTADGLRATDIRTADGSFTINGSAGWEVDTREPTGQRTWVNATLTSSDVDATMQRLNSRPGIDGKDMQIAFDVSWSGGPREDFLSSLDGEFDVRFGTGQLVEVEPGAGRMFGLMSVVALPRRLALDFRDVLDKGFVFDEITGTFRVDDGNAYTCDLSLKGPAADIGIVGRAGLVAEDYDQAAIVSANVGNTLPVVGAVVAGPQVAAALLIFSQIFKKPLQEMGQVYYSIEGSWDKPQVDTANPRRFADVSKLAGCIEPADRN